MIFSKKITSALLTSLIAFLIAFAPFNTVSANAMPLGDEVIRSVDGETKIKIKIIIIIIRKKKGIVEITGMRLAGDTKSLKKNEVLADAYVEEGKLFIFPSRGIAARSQYILPNGFKVDKTLGLKLGAKGGFSLKAGKMDLRTNKLGNFEIQD